MVCGVPEDTAALADRLGRYLPADTEPVSQELEEGIKGRAARRARAQRLAERARLAALDEELANREWGVRLGGVDLGAASLDDVRRQILVSDTGSQLFAGTLQDAIDPHGRLTRAAGRGGRARGQRRGRVRRAAGRLAGRARRARSRAVRWPAPAGRAGAGARRRGTRSWCWSSPRRRWTPTPRRGSPHAWRPSARARTTVVSTVSPLWLHHADRVVALRGRPSDRGRHPRGPAARQPGVPPCRRAGDGRARGGGVGP